MLICHILSCFGGFDRKKAGLTLGLYGKEKSLFREEAGDYIKSHFVLWLPCEKKRKHLKYRAANFSMRLAEIKALRNAVLKAKLALGTQNVLG